MQYKQGPVLEENHYYPFGLAMAGINDKASKSNYTENKYRFNGQNELQNKEFSDGSGLEEYDAENRMYEPQLGRFWQLDPLAEETPDFSPYAFANDNPIGYNDPDGLDTTTRKTNLDPVVVTAPKTPARADVNSGLADTKGNDPSSIAAANPVSNVNSSTDNNGSSTAVAAGGLMMTLGKIGEGIEITITGTASIPVVLGGVAVYGAMKWAWPKTTPQPTNVPTVDISIGIPKPYIPPGLNRRLSQAADAPPYPGNDPAKQPAPGYEWRSKVGAPPGAVKGEWYNPNTGENLDPDLDHALPKGPHWGWRAPDGKFYDLFPDGRVEPR